MGEQSYLCPVCRSPHELHRHAKISVLDHFRILLIVGMIAGVAYWLGGVSTALKSLVCYLPIWAAWELVHWALVREEMVCKVCGFDALLYLRDVKQARSQVESRLQTVQDEYMLKIGEKRKRIAEQNSQKITATRESVSKNI